MNKKTFLQGVALCAFLVIPVFLDATPNKPSLTNRQLQAIIKALKQPKTLTGLGIAAGIVMLSTATYKLLRRADTAVHHTGEMTSNIAALLNPEKLMDEKYREALTTMLTAITKTGIESYVLANARIEGAEKKENKLVQKSTIMQILEAIVNNKELRELLQNTVEGATRAYVTTQNESQAACSSIAPPIIPEEPAITQLTNAIAGRPELQALLVNSITSATTAYVQAQPQKQPEPPTHEPGAVYQIITGLAHEPALAATISYNLAHGYGSAGKSTGPTVSLQPAPGNNPWFFTRWKQAIHNYLQKAS